MSSKKVVVLSYAHYPRKAGASYNGVSEHELSILWTNQLKTVLEIKGFHVFLTPIGGLTNKVKFLNTCNADLAIEIHFNGSSNPTVSGVETLYCPGSSQGIKAARDIHIQYAPVMGCKDRGVKEGWYRMDKPYIEDYPGDVEGDEKPDYFLKYTNCPALILEPEFISQQDTINSHMVGACAAIGHGVCTYLECYPCR